MNNPKRADYVVSGFVQGVGFRYFVMKHASILGLTGYAKNLMDGRVEVVAEGEESNLAELYKLLRSGPSRSYVEDVKVTYNEYKNEFSGFNIR